MGEAARQLQPERKNLAKGILGSLVVGLLLAFCRGKLLKEVARNPPDSGSPADCSQSPRFWLENL